LKPTKRAQCKYRKSSTQILTGPIRGLIGGIIVQAFRDAKEGGEIGAEAREWLQENAIDWAVTIGISLPAGWEKFCGNPERLRENAKDKIQEIIQREGLRLDPDSRKAELGGKNFILGSHEFKLLYVLARQQPGKCITAQELGSWLRPGCVVNNNQIYVYVNSLRKQFEEDPNQPKFIVAEWRRGYRLTI
jgi:DNA-binding winged helix-turn-helix (wHTH) protein